MHSLLHFFHSIWRWDETERCETRRVWLEYYGVPLHTWSADTFSMLGGQWKEVVGCDKVTESCMSFSVGRVQIDTCIMDMINEWVHIIIGVSGFDVLVKEVGREAFGLNCYEEANEKSDYSCEQRGIVAERECVGTSLRSARATKLAVFNDQAADVVMGELREDGEDKDRLVIPKIILNEWISDHSKQNQVKTVTYQPIYEGIEGRADCVECDHINYEVDYEDTVTWIYESNFNGLEMRGKRNKKKKALCRLGARPNNSKLSKKDREGSLDPTSSINRFGDVGLGLKSESGLMEIEHGFYDRDGHAREGSTTSVQEAASAKLVLETGAEKIERD
ncbi:hypothetical protein AHAS_Ahas13G0225800 [Arachis hypogaea]